METTSMLQWKSLIAVGVIAVSASMTAGCAGADTTVAEDDTPGEANEAIVSGGRLLCSSRYGGCRSAKTSCSHYVSLRSGFLALKTRPSLSARRISKLYDRAIVKPFDSNGDHRVGYTSFFFLVDANFGAHGNPDRGWVAGHWIKEIC